MKPYRHQGMMPSTFPLPLSSTMRKNSLMAKISCCFSMVSRKPFHPHAAFAIHLFLCNLVLTTILHVFSFDLLALYASLLLLYPYASTSFQPLLLSPSFLPTLILSEKFMLFQDVLRFPATVPLKCLCGRGQGLLSRTLWPKMQCWSSQFCTRKEDLSGPRRPGWQTGGILPDAREMATGLYFSGAIDSFSGS